ncbi:MAG: DUF418 domain-containing protein [Actinomycetota bacterium]
MNSETGTSRLSTPGGPVTRGERITNLDTIRGWATLGILLMNVVSFALPAAAYFNLDGGGSDTWLDWVIGMAGEVFADQKMMGLFSLLFGAGVALFADRTAAKGGSPVGLSLWRNLLLLGIGFLHALLWDGDILMVYAMASPFVVLLRNRRPRTLIITGVGIFVLAVITGLATATTVSPDGAELGELWSNDPGAEMSDTVGLWFLVEFGGRALGMMLIGVAMFRLRILDGTRDPAADRRMAVWGLGLGLPVAAIAVAILAINDFDPQWFLPTHVMNTAATIPVVLGYVGVISLWNRRGDGPLHERIRAVGRMALTNYLTQTLLGVLVLANLFDAEELSRTGALVFVLAVWALQLAWSKPWLERFRFGPFEWAWRVLTYRKIQPIRR